MRLVVLGQQRLEVTRIERLLGRLGNREMRKEVEKRMLGESRKYQM